MKIAVHLIFVLLIALGCKTRKPVVEILTGPNTLSAAEKALGWELLFDGKNMDSWRLYNSEGVQGWKIENDQMIALGIEGLSADIITTDTFRNFELSVEWSISVQGNSGIFYNVKEEKSLQAVYHSGPEYQLVDDEGFLDPLKDWQLSGANYAMHAPRVNAYNPQGTFNRTRIIVDNGYVQHWLNGLLVVSYQLWSPEWEELKKKRKWKDFPSYGIHKSGHIALQDHGNQVKFKNIKIRKR